MQAQRLLYATHDWPNTTTATPDRWIDVKRPGDGRTYSVGTTTVESTDPLSPNRTLFSNFSVVEPSGVLVVLGSRQVAVMQVTAAQGTVWQTYFYGETPNQGLSNGLPTHARAIAVYPGTTPSETRIVICGNTFDQRLPGAVTSPNNNWAMRFASGFIAVYSGGSSQGPGALLWSYQFFGDDPSASTMITDVAVHREGDTDVITYCGVTTNGAYVPQNATPISTMQPKLPFPITGNSTAPCGDQSTGGDFHEGPLSSASSQWDGIVGRLVMPHTGPYNQTAPQTLQFHSIVGGSWQDGLFGISEIDENNFVVVGSTTRGTAASGTSVVPLTNPKCFNNTNQFCFNPPATFPPTPPTWSSFGTLFWFHAGPPRSGAQLILLGSTLIGSEHSNTVARDVLWQGGLMWITGSTDDRNFTSMDPHPFVGAPPGPPGTFDGFLATCANPNDPIKPINLASFVGGPLNDAATGVAGWNEYPDHVALGGWSDTAGNGKDLFVDSWFHDTTAVPSRLRRLRSLMLGGSEDDQTVHVDGVWPGWGNPSYLNLVGNPEGGGAAMDERGRVTIVGSTNSRFSATLPGSANFPGTNPLFPVPDRAPQAGHTNNDTDSVRAEVEMLPTGVCRTDGTGVCPSTGWIPGVTYTGNGGTTPSCALSLFGNLLGAVAPQLNRQLIDIEGDVLASSANVAILLDRPAFGSGLQGSVMKIGFPSSLPDSLLAPYGIDAWVISPASVGLYYTANNVSLRVPLAQLPPGANVFSIQFVSWLATPVCSNQAFTLGASPALIFGY